MATKNQTALPVVQGAKKSIESVYSTSELGNVARTRFGIPPEVVQAALKHADKAEATIAEAQQLVKEFMGRKVK